jgi:hypothetical protein
VNMQVISLHSPINGVFILVEGSIVVTFAHNKD